MSNDVYSNSVLAGHVFEFAFLVKLIETWQQNNQNNFNIISDNPIYLEILNICKCNHGYSFGERISNLSKWLRNTVANSAIEQGYIQEVYQYASSKAHNFFRNNIDKLEYAQFGFINETALLIEAKERNFRSFFGNFGLKPVFFGNKNNTKGHFINADFLFIFKNPSGTKYRIVLIDTSHKATSSIADFKGCLENSIERMLQETKQKRSSTYSTNLQCLTAKNTQYITNENIEQTKKLFYHIFVENRDVAKLIQAMSYTYTFLDYLTDSDNYLDDGKKALDFINKIESVTCVGLSTLMTAQTFDLGCGNKEIMDSVKSILKLANETYIKALNRGESAGLDSSDFISDEYTNIKEKLSKPEEAEEIENNTYISGKDFEQLNMDVRKHHTKEVKRALSDPKIDEVLLLACPGIGKTYSVIDHIITAKDEKSLFFYASPRLAILESVRAEFERVETLEKKKRVVILYADFVSLSGEGASRYISIAYQGYNKVEEDVISEICRYFQEINDPITFFTRNNKNDDESYNKALEKANRHSRDEINGDDTYVSYSYISSEGKKGVLDVLTDKGSCFVNMMRDSGLTPDVVTITTSLQAMEKISSDNRTSFSCRMWEKCEHIDSLYYMLDEITGSEGTMCFIRDFRDSIFNKVLGVGKNDLPEYIERIKNLKFIPCDASILDHQTYTALTETLEKLSSDMNKPERFKESVIFTTDKRNTGISTDYSNGNIKGRAINFSGYPASKLNVSFALIYEREKYIRMLALKVIESQRKGRYPIVYIQSKDECKELETEINNQDKRIKTVLINSNNRYDQDRMKSTEVFIITSSASRGVSFPKSLETFIVFPNFKISQNIMELNQVIYRMRGGYLDENGKRVTHDNDEKHLNMYLKFNNKDKIDYNELAAVRSVMTAKRFISWSMLSRISDCVDFGNIGVFDKNIEPTYKKLQAFGTFGQNLQKRQMLRTNVENFSAFKKQLEDNYDLDDSTKMVLSDMCDHYLQLKTIDSVGATKSELFLTAIANGTIKDDLYYILKKSKAYNRYLSTNMLIINDCELKGVRKDFSESERFIYEKAYAILKNINTNDTKLKKIYNENLKHIIGNIGYSNPNKRMIDINKLANEKSDKATIFIFLNGYDLTDEQNNIIWEWISEKYEIPKKEIYFRSIVNSNNSKQYNITAFITKNLNEKEILADDCLYYNAAVAGSGLNKRTLDMTFLDTELKIIT